MYIMFCREGVRINMREYVPNALTPTPHPGKLISRFFAKKKGIKNLIFEDNFIISDSL